MAGCQGPIRGLAILAVLAVGGCLPLAAGLAGPGLAVGSTAMTGKTPVDHAVSAIAGKDCSVVRSRQGLTYCREDEPTMPVTVSCYRTIGDVSCHPRAVVQPGRQRPVDGSSAAPTAPASPVPASPAVNGAPAVLPVTDPADAG